MGGYSLQKLTEFQEPESKFPEYSPERRFPGQMLEMKGFRSFSKMTLLCLQSGFFIETSLEDSNMFAL